MTFYLYSHCRNYTTSATFYLFKKVKNGFKFFSLSFVGTLLPKTQFGCDESVVDDVEDVAVVVLEEDQSFVSVGVVKKDPEVFRPSRSVPLRVQDLGCRLLNILRLFRRLPLAEHLLPL